MVLRSVGIFSCGKVLGMLYGLLGAIFGVLGGLLFLAFGVAVQQAQAGQAMGPAMFGAAAIIILPLIYGIGGFIGGFLWGIITALFYNLVAAMVGGIEFDFVDRAPRWENPYPPSTYPGGAAHS